MTTRTAIVAALRAAGALVAASVLGCAGAVTLGGAASPAHAAAGDVTVSLDGIHFATTLPTGLFDSAERVVPNDELHSTLWVRNNTQLDGELWLSRVTPAGSTTVLSSALTLYETGTVPVGPGVPGSDGVTCALIASPRPLRAGATVELPLTLAVADLDGHDGQNQRVDLALVAALADPSGPPPEDGSCPRAGSPITGGPSGPAPGDAGPRDGSAMTGPLGLAFTGGGVATSWIMLGGLLVGAGLFVLVARRRERHRS